MAKNKYNARKITLPNGDTFDSQKELARWRDLMILERAGVIEQLKRQVRFELIPPQKGARRHERGVDYVADFTYLAGGKLVVEDVKSPATRTPVYIIKRKLLLWRHGIEICEV